MPLSFELGAMDGYNITGHIEEDLVTGFRSMKLCAGNRTFVPTVLSPGTTSSGIARCFRKDVRAYRHGPSPKRL